MSRRRESTIEQWAAIDRYVEQHLIGADVALERATAAAAAAGLPAAAVTPAQGKLLQLLARAIGARRILELGTLGGYSTIWLARALPRGGRLITLEANPSHAAVARANIENAGLQVVVELCEGPALATLSELAGEGTEPFDFVFIDADKQNTPRYFELTLGITRPGSLIVADNVVRAGALVDFDSDDPAALGGRGLHELLAHNLPLARRASATTIQTVGVKGHDGFTLALVTDGQR